MAEELHLTDGLGKAARYEEILPQIEAVVSGEPDCVANLANTSAILKEAFGFLWVGFYLVKEDELVLGPFQGPLACTRIQKGKGVCGTAWAEKRTLVVEDVDQFPGHIACSSASRSEIVVPLMKSNEVVGVLDVDSEALSTFDQVDAEFLNNLCELLITTSFQY